MENEEISPDVDTFKKEQVSTLNQLYKTLTLYYTFERDLIIYRLLTWGKVGVADMARAMGVSQYRIRQLMDKFQKRLGDQLA